MSRSVCWLLILPGLLAAPADAADKPNAKTSPTFETQIRPILKANCFDCHGEGAKLKGHLDLRLARLIVKGGRSGPAIVPGQPDESLLWQRVRAGEMPPGKHKLSADQVALIGRWIAAGAKVQHAEPANVAAGMLITPEDRAFWAFQPIRRPPVPPVAAAERVRTPLDAFVLAQLHAHGLTFAPEADRRTLIRRATLDVTGLPPTPEEVAAFLADPAPDAYERLIDRLLASPQYGECWGRHWLDVAGYADSEGYAREDTIRPSAYKYRDYVIRSFNADKPFDQFIQEQLAGDEMLRPPYQNLSADDLDKLIATGFLRMAPDGTGSAGVDQKAARNQVLTDTIKIISNAFLGLTVNCAQCHNHRYDPIPQADFYRLRALLEPAYDVHHWRTPAARKVSLYTAADRRQAQAIEAEAAKVDQERLKKQQQFIEATFQKELAKLSEEQRGPVRAAWQTPAAQRTAGQKQLLKEHPSVNVTAGSLYLYDSRAAAELKKLAAQAAALRARKPVEDFIRALTEVPGQVPVTYLFHRGDPDQPKQAVVPAGLTILEDHLPLSVSAKDPSRPTTGRRLAFARWLTDRRNPLTARVLVNRVWMHHFGRGLVGTPTDFGKLGERPTHPQLLDWLASEFMTPSPQPSPPRGEGQEILPSSPPRGEGQEILPSSPPRGEGRVRGWSLKSLHRLILTSTVYRQVSRRDSVTEAIDPDNRLLGRMNVRRLEAEALRDSVLAVSGHLVRKPFGPPVPVKENEVGQFVLGIENKDGAGRFTAAVPLPAGEASRRSVYVQVRRSRPLGVLDTFDGATPEPNCEARIASTVTPQALMLMNSAVMLSESEAFAARLQREAGADPRAQIVRAWRLAFAAEPNEAQIRAARQFLAEETRYFQANPPQPHRPGKKNPPAALSPAQRALDIFCQALFSSNRFLYVD